MNKEQEMNSGDYPARLLEPGWAGILSLDEAEYIKCHLERNVGLRRRWRIKRKKVPITMIAEKAYPENPIAARRHIKKEQQREWYKKAHFNQNLTSSERAHQKEMAGTYHRS